MAIDPISLTLMFLFGAATGATVAIFWDEIKAWAVRVIGYILDGINWAIEVTSNAIVYLVKQGTRYYKRAEVFVRNVGTGRIVTRYREQEVSEDDVPYDLRESLYQEPKLKVAEYRIS